MTTYPGSPISGDPEEAYAALLGRPWPEELLVAVWPGPFHAFHAQATTAMAVTVVALADVGLLTLRCGKPGPALLHPTLPPGRVHDLGATAPWFRDAVLWYASNEPGIALNEFAGDWFRTVRTARRLGLIQQVGRWRKTWQPTQEVTESTQALAVSAGKAWGRFRGHEPVLCRQLLHELTPRHRPNVDTNL
jgi:hypothetical protein